MEKKKTNIFPFLYLIFGLYFLNSGINYFEIPEGIYAVHNIIVLLGGVVLLFAFFRSIIHSKKRILRRALKHQH